MSCYIVHLLAIQPHSRLSEYAKLLWQLSVQLLMDVVLATKAFTIVRMRRLESQGFPWLKGWYSLQK
jgi:hypothetical protein